MSITNYRSVQRINDTANKNLTETEEQFHLEMNAIKEKRNLILQEARLALEQRAIEKISGDIHDDGK